MTDEQHASTGARPRGDVGASREQARRRRLVRVATVLGVPAAYLWYRILDGRPFHVFALPDVDPLLVVPVLFFAMLALLLLGTTVGAGRSPHQVFRPEQIDTGFDDVVGIEPVKEDVVRSLELFLAYRSFRAQMGGTPRRGLLFEGPPGTGKTHLAKAMAREAGVPFLFVSATSFQSMYYGATARKIRSYFRALRKAARQEGGAIGFIEEIDAIAMSRRGVAMSPLPASPAGSGVLGTTVLGCGGLTGLPVSYAASATGAGPVVHPSMTSEGTGGVVNELLVQMQSFDEPTGAQKLRMKVVDGLNLLLPEHRQLPRPVPPSANVLLIAATNRGDDLDPALLRPGRFDRRLAFEAPDKRGRRALLDHFLARKAHAPELADDEHRDALAGLTSGYTPVMIEHLLDEALVNAVRRGDDAMSWQDVERARLTEEVGLGQPVSYTPHETRLIATHEAGHATVAWLVAPERRLEVLTIIKRKGSLGLLAHGDREDVYTRSRTEMTALIRIAMGGQAAEQLFFGDVSTGPGGDLLYATNVAADMVGSCGMLDTLTSYAAVQSGAVSATNMVGRVLAHDDARQRVEALLQEQRAYVLRLLALNRHLVEALRDALVERLELIGSQITEVLEAAAAERPVLRPEDAEPGRQAPLTVDLRDGAAAYRHR